MQKVLIALMAMAANAFAPASAPRATVVQQGVPLANGAMEFDREAPASGMFDALRRQASPTRARSRVQQLDKYDDAGVCREWRCKYEGDKATSASLEACSKVLDDYLPELKRIDGVTVNRAVQCANLNCCCVRSMA